MTEEEERRKKEQGRRNKDEGRMKEEGSRKNENGGRTMKERNGKKYPPFLKALLVLSMVQV